MAPERELVDAACCEVEGCCTNGWNGTISILDSEERSDSSFWSDRGPGTGDRFLRFSTLSVGGDKGTTSSGPLGSEVWPPVCPPVDCLLRLAIRFSGSLAPLGLVLLGRSATGGFSLTPFLRALVSGMEYTFKVGLNAKALSSLHPCLLIKWSLDVSGLQWRASHSGHARL